MISTSFRRIVNNSVRILKHDILSDRILRSENDLIRFSRLPLSAENAEDLLIHIGSRLSTWQNDDREHPAHSLFFP